jgi:DNA (cytosine-5)-methyltransferase 1
VQVFCKKNVKNLQKRFYPYICCMEKLTHGSLFSGIGGFDLAAEWMGWENKFHCEWNDFGQKVLHHYWPEAECFTDITKSDFKKYYGKIDILTGGFPCQPYSSAGKRKGKEDERHLWPEMLRAIREVSPRFVVGENVRGLTNWNGGLVFEEVCAELESYGYQVAPVIIPACGVGAPHRRERIWFVAQNTMRSGLLQRESIEKGAEIWQQRNTSTGSSNRVYISDGITANTNGAEQRNNDRTNDREAEKVWRQNKGNVSRELSSDGDATYSKGVRFQKSSEVGKLERTRSKFTGKRTNWDQFPTQSPVCSGDDGLPGELDGITFPKWRNESIKAYGNAIVPQVAYQIFQAIEKTLYL